MNPQKQAGGCLGMLFELIVSLIMIAGSLIGLAITAVGWMLWVVGALGTGIWVVLLLVLAVAMLG